MSAAKAPRRRERARGDAVLQVLESVRFLSQGRRTTRELAAHLGVSLRTAWRIVAALPAAGLELVSEPAAGGETFHHLTRTSVKRLLGL